MKPVHDSPNPASSTAPSQPQVLRRLAEATLLAREVVTPQLFGAEETGRLLHELRVHQIELEMQNEELRRAQEELDVSRTRFVDLYDFAPVGYVTVSESGLILDANLTAVTLLGVARSALLTQPLTRFILPEDQDIYYRHRMTLLETGAPHVCELRLQRSDSPPFWARLEATADRDNESGMPISRVVLSNISERKRTEAALHEGEERFRAAFEHGIIGMMITSLDGRLLQVNAALCKMLGYTEAELEARSFVDITHPDELVAHRVGRQRIINGEIASFRMERRYFQKNGNQVWGDMGMFAVRDTVGTPCYLVTHVVDITARKQAETSLRQLNAEMHTVLEARVQERTAELAAVIEELHRETSARLRAEEKERAAVIEERTRIAREIHDTLAQGFTGIIIQLQVADEMLLEDVEATRAHMLRACALARASLVEARRSVWALRPRLLEGSNLPSAFAEMIEQFPHDASVTLEFSCNGAQRPLPSDLEHDLLRIGQESMNNAMKYASARRVRIALIFDDRQVTLRVEDDGCGFDASQWRRQGFGLRIMVERAERQGGKLVLTSQPGHGTCVEALVPFPADAERNRP